jgi:predicted permease
MAPGRTIEDVREELGRIAAGLRASRADTNADLHLHATSLREDMIRDNGQLMVGLMAAVGFLLILACVNVTTMFVARFIARRREVGIRVALGAARGREIRGFVVETLLLFLAGGGIALILALWLGDVVSGLLPDGMRSDFGIRGLSLTPTLALFTAGVALVAGALVGIASALRGGKVNVMTALRASSRSVAGPAGRLQRGLVVTQLALSLALLVGAGVLFQHFRRLSTQELGFEIDELYTLRISLEQDRYGSPDERARVIGELTNSLSLLPGVESVGYTTVNPLCCGDWGAPLAVEGQPQPEGSTHLIHHRMVGPGYFATMGTPLLRGRDFDSRDRPGSPPSVIVDEALADRFWPGADPVGRRVRLDRPGSEWMTVVGVVGSLVEEGDYTETWYLPYTRDPTARSGENLHFMLRAEDASALQEARRAVRQVDADLAVYGLAPMASLRSENISQDRLGATVGAGFGGFGLLLAALGVFGMLSYTVSARSRELGIRIALGSHPTELTTLVLKSAGTLAAAGAGIGLALAFGLNRVLEAVVFGVDRASPALLAGLAAVLLLAALAAASLPALRASRVDPVQVLKD